MVDANVSMASPSAEAIGAKLATMLSKGLAVESPEGLLALSSIADGSAGLVMFASSCRERIARYRGFVVENEDTQGIKPWLKGKVEAVWVPCIGSAKGPPSEKGIH